MILEFKKVNIFNLKNNLVRGLVAGLGLSVLYAGNNLANAEEVQSKFQVPQETPKPVDAVPAPTEKLDQSIDHKKMDKPYYFVIGEGKTLPQNVLRFRNVAKFVDGTYGFDKDGKKEDLGIKLKIMANVFAFEYGLTEDLSAMMLVPVIVSNNASLNADKFRQSNIYKDNYNNFIGKMVALLKSKGLCPTSTACNQLVENGYALPVDTPVMLPTGEVLNAKAGIPLKQYADALVINAAAPQNGKTGIGDLEVGVIYELINARGPFTGTPIYVSFALGLRIPTGEFKEVPFAMRAPGRGTVDGAFRLNIDYNPHPAYFINIQNQTEIMLASTTKERSSLINPGVLNEGNPTLDANVALGADNIKNSQKFERRSMRNVGFVKTQLGLGVFDDYLKVLALLGYFKYDFEGIEYLDGVKQADRKSTLLATVGGMVSGLPYKIPLQGEVEYDMPVGGKNAKVNPGGITYILKAYYRF